MPLPAGCQAIADDLEHARTVLKDIQSSPNYLDHGKPDPGMLEEAEKEEHLIAELTAQLNACLRKHGWDPDTICVFSGTATVDSPLGSGSAPFKIELQFEPPHHKTFFVETFPPLHVKPKHADGYTATVTQTGGGNGTFDPGTGAVELGIDLDADIHPDPAGSLTLAIKLGTAHGGKAMDGQGKVKLVGSTEAKGHGAGTPDEVEVTMILDGRITPHP